jgi:thiol-disulfide isomerase/thioredoxin
MTNLPRVIGIGLLSIASALGISSAQNAGTTAPEFQANGIWINSSPKKVSDFKGKVLLVNIWVHSCINCHNSLPTLRTWYAKYKAQGFEIVGVHTPEFESDKDPTALKNSLIKDNITWAVFQDNLERTWQAYNNRYWPPFTSWIETEKSELPTQVNSRAATQMRYQDSRKPFRVYWQKKNRSPKPLLHDFYGKLVKTPVCQISVFTSRHNPKNNLNYFLAHLEPINFSRCTHWKFL